MAFIYKGNPQSETKEKTIDTLVPDIYDYIGGQGTFDKVTDEDAEELGKLLADMIKTRLNERRESKGERQFTLRMSNYGKPNRYLWYEANYKGKKEKNEPHVYLKFLLGDVFECVMLFLAEKSGHSVTHLQQKVSVDGLDGSLDAVIDGVLVDVKSASKWAFQKKFLDRGIFNGDDGFAYVPQIKGYSKGVPEAKGEAFFVGNKETGDIVVVKVPPSIKVDVEGKIASAREAISSEEPPPEKCYPEEETSYGNRKLAKGCVFCPFKYDCWKDANDGKGLRVFEYAKGPEFLTHVERAPNMPERPRWEDYYAEETPED